MPARLLGGRYRLTNMLGQGGMASVWAGVDTRLNRAVAVKILNRGDTADAAMLKRLDHEAHTLAGLEHPNIVAVYDLGGDDGVPYVVMELVRGDDLERRLTDGALDVAEAVRIATQICAALQAAHDSGVIHRDIKPDNILLTESGLVKVCDFGIARLQRSQQSGPTNSATAIGTAMYMAPEQATGGPVDARSDLYALGCVLYAMLVGQPPFVGNSMRVLWQHVHEAPAPVGARRPDLPRELDALVSELLAKNPSNRPASARQVRDRLAHLVDSPVATGAAQLAASPSAAAHGRATVKPRTMTMPAVVDAGEHPVSPRFRLGPMGISAVAVGVAIVTALVILYLTTAIQPTASAPSITGSSSLPSPTVPVTSPVTTTGSLRAVIQSQALAGELDEDAARDLLNRLEDVDRDLARGRVAKAGQKIEELGERLNELVDDGKVTEGARAAIQQGLDQLVNGLPPQSQD
ncbi:MAG: protein kinase domain-containing protein [Micromonosporaceae bacterium]